MRSNQFLFLVFFSIFFLRSSFSFAQANIVASSGGSGVDTTSSSILNLPLNDPTSFAFALNEQLNSDSVGNGTLVSGSNNLGVSANPPAGEPVNTYTGNAYETVSDFNYPRPGFPLKYERYFEVGTTSSYGELGLGWMSNYDMSLVVPAAGSNYQVMLISPHVSYNFKVSGSGASTTYTPQPSCFYQLQYTNNGAVTYVLTDQYGIQYNFTVLGLGNASGVSIASLMSMNDLNGNSVTLTYQTNSNNKTGYSLQEADGYIGGVKNWGVAFSYYSSSSRISQVESVDFSQGSGTVLDTITFDTGAQTTGPVTQVDRSPSNLNATYQYYSYNGSYPVPNSTPVIVPVVSLKQIVDAQQQPGFRNLNYVSKYGNNATVTGAISNPVLQIQNGQGQVMYTFTYGTNSGQKVNSVIGPNGLMAQYTYTQYGQMIQKMTSVDGHPFYENYVWNAQNQLTYVSKSNGYTENLGYDNLGNQIFLEDSMGNRSFYSFDSKSRMVSSQDANQVIRSYIYDESENLVSKIEPGRTTNYSYYPNGLVHTVTDGRQNTTSYTYDANGFVSQVTDPLSAAVSTTYNSRGQLLSSKDPKLQTTYYTYTSNEMWLYETQFPDGTTQTVDHDSYGAPLTITDRAGNKTVFVYDSNTGYKTDSYQAYGTSVAQHTVYTNDVLGHVLSFQDNRGNKTSYVYNESNLVRSMRDAIGDGYTNVYDGQSNLLTSTDTRGVTKSMAYYSNNRLQTVKFSDGSPSVSYTYDGNGNRLSMTDGIGAKSYSYDSLNNLTQVVDSDRSFTLNYAYDSVGNRISSRNSKTPGMIFYSYYADNTAQAVTDVDGTVTSYYYDSMKNPISIVGANGVSFVYQFDYTNHTNRLVSIQTTNSAGEVIASYGYVYDAVGNATTITGLSGPTTYSYDDLYQVLSATRLGAGNSVLSNITYSYDGMGNRSQIGGQSYDNGNELNSAGSNSYQYDKAGNMTKAGLVSYTWDASNRLTRISSTTSLGPVTYIYDGDNHRVQKLSAAATINYFYDGNSEVLETDGSGNITKTFCPGIRVTDKQGNKLYYLFNGHSDVTGLMDANQNLVQSYNYDTYGNTLGESKDINANRYAGTSGVYADDDACLQYMLNRWYNPVLGRFISRDLIGIQGGMNLYVYTGNNPIVGIDILGLCNQGTFSVGVGAMLPIPSLINTMLSFADPFDTISREPQQFLSGSISAGASTELQWFLQLSGSITTGSGLFLGAGPQLGPGTAGPVIQNGATTVSETDVNVGLDPFAGGASVQQDENGTSYSAGVPLSVKSKNIGFGIGFQMSKGTAINYTLATPPSLNR